MKFKNAGTKSAYLGLFCALTLILSIVEGMILNILPFPGIKLGFANIGIIIILYIFGLPSAILTGIIKSVFIGIFSGNIMSIAYSFAATITSILFMYVFKKLFKNNINIIFISVLGAEIHNTVQIIAAGIIMHSFSVILYLPLLLIAAVLCGALTGFIASLVLSRLNNISKGSVIKKC